MADIVSSSLQWLNANPQLAGLLTFIISASESIAVVGTIVPGSIMMTGIGALAGAGIIPLWETIVWAILGAILGDGISYWLGHYFKGQLPTIWPFRTHPTLLVTGKRFFFKYGSMSVFIGRFVGPVRALVPVVAGMLGMKPLQFTLANVTSAIIWAPAYMLPGILVGAFALELPPEIATHVILGLVFVTLFISLCLWFIYKLFQLVHNQLTQLQNKIWQSLKKSRHFSAITIILKHYQMEQTHGQFALALLFIFVSILFFALVIYVKIETPVKLTVNGIMFHLFRGLTIRSDWLNSAMIDITLLAQKQIILPAALILAIWFFLQKRLWTALHVLILITLAGGSVFVIKHLAKIPRPWGIFHAPSTYSMPSGHTVLATTLYVGLALLLAASCAPKKRWPFYTAAITIVFAVSLSRLYLGAHWFTDVLAGWLLSIALLSLITISYRRRKEKTINPLVILLVSISAIAIFYLYYQPRHITQLEKDYAQIHQPPTIVEMDDWWQKNGNLSSYRVSLFGYPSQLINIQWAGNINQIRETLFKAGWTRPPTRDIISTLHRLADVSSTKYLPMISPQYLDANPALILTRDGSNGKILFVIRLWNSNRIIRDSQETLWVGTLGVVPRSYSWLFKKKGNEYYH